MRGRAKRHKMSLDDVGAIAFPERSMRFYVIQRLGKTYFVEKTLRGV